MLKNHQRALISRFDSSLKLVNVSFINHRAEMMKTPNVTRPAICEKKDSRNLKGIRNLHQLNHLLKM